MLLVCKTHNEKRAQRFHLTRTNEFFVLHLIFKIWTGWWVRVLLELWAHMQLSGSPQQTNSPEPVWPFWEPLHYVQRRNPHYKTTIPRLVWKGYGIPAVFVTNPVSAGAAAWRMNFPPKKYCSAVVMHEANTKEEEATSGIKSNKRKAFFLRPVSQQDLCFYFIAIPYPNHTNDFSTINISKKKKPKTNQNQKKKPEGNTRSFTRQMAWNVTPHDFSSCQLGFWPSSYITTNTSFSVSRGSCSWLLQLTVKFLWSF